MKAKEYYKENCTEDYPSDENDIVSLMESYHQSQLQALKEGVEVFIEQSLGLYRPKVKIGSETFSIGSGYEEKADAQWLCKMFKKAISNLITNLEDNGYTGD